MTESSLTGIAYYSEANQHFDNESLRELAIKAASKNAAADITGLLIFVDGHFMQYLEGDAAALDTLLIAIRADERHKILTEYVDVTLEERRFPAWNMRWLMDDELNQSKLQEQLSERFLEKDIIDAATREKEIWRVVDGLGAVYRQLT